MDKDRLILGALLHDIGKFWQSYPEDLPGYPKEELLPKFSRSNIDKKIPTHARWSAQFIHKYKHLFSGADDLIDLVLYHSSPRNKDELVISVADKLSSIERRFEEQPHKAILE